LWNLICSRLRCGSLWWRWRSLNIGIKGFNEFKREIIKEIFSNLVALSESMTLYWTWRGKLRMRSSHVGHFVYVWRIKILLLILMLWNINGMIVSMIVFYCHSLAFKWTNDTPEQLIHQLWNRVHRIDEVILWVT
jgi:hypothetical protein